MSNDVMSPAEPSKSARILIADDDMEIRCLLAAALRQCGYRVSQARDGLELLVALSAMSTQELEAPAAVISDVRMPIYNGIDALRNARSFGLDVPFILMTAHRDPEVVANATQNGASALFAKPFELDQLLREVKTLVAKSA